MRVSYRFVLCDPPPHPPMFYKKNSCPILFYSNIFIKFSPTFYLASGRLYTNVQSSEFCLHIWSLASQATSSKAKLTKRNKNFNSHKFHFLWPVTPKPVWYTKSKTFPLEKSFANVLCDRLLWTKWLFSDFKSEKNTTAPHCIRHTYLHLTDVRRTGALITRDGLIRQTSHVLLCLSF